MNPSLGRDFEATDPLLRVDRLYVHQRDRDWPSYAGLLLLGLLWTLPLLPGWAAQKRSA
jgi:hypothetical protein